MPKQYSINDIKNLCGNLVFNYNPINKTTGEQEYYVAAIIFSAYAEGNGASADPVEGVVTFGNPQAIPFTLKEIYRKIKSKMGQNVADKIKEVAKKLTGDDISI